MATRQRVYFGGVPIAPDVQKLMDQWPDLSMGDFIPYEEVKDALQQEKGSYRFNAVTRAWRRRVEDETNLIVGTRAGEGFVVLDDSERGDLGVSTLRSAVKKAKRSGRVLSGTNRAKLLPDQQARVDHAQMVSAHLLTASKLKQGKLPPPPAVEPLPRG